MRRLSVNGPIAKVASVMALHERPFNICAFTWALCVKVIGPSYRKTPVVISLLSLSSGAELLLPATSSAEMRNSELVLEKFKPWIAKRLSPVCSSLRKSEMSMYSKLKASLLGRSWLALELAVGVPRNRRRREGPGTTSAHRAARARHARSR